jgi:choline dehydrogenase-like flavoprotein
LRLRGLHGVRIVDASVIPKMVSGNTQAAVLMVAERGADLVLEAAKG